MQELRQGVKLKKTDYTKTPFEYELTPYEMLMDDIRSRRYSLVLKLYVPSTHQRWVFFLPLFLTGCLLHLC